MGQDYDKRYEDSPIHYDALENLAGFFGRSMAVHRHAQYLQIHYIDRGKIHFQIDTKVYLVEGPALVLTPPSVPHSFFSAPEACGHVVTLHQSLVWQLLKDGLQRLLGTGLDNEFCLSLKDLSGEEVQHWNLITQSLNNLAAEWNNDFTAKQLSLQSWVRLLLIQLARIGSKSIPNAASTDLNNDDLQYFRRFATLIQEYYTEHWHLDAYASTLGISASRLHQVCQRVANQAPKQIIHDRLMQEAKRLLTFTNLSSSEICYQLGFSDPAYFSRFFKRNTGVTVLGYRQQLS